MPNFTEVKKNFLNMDGRTYARTYRWTFETGFIRSTLSISRPKQHIITKIMFQGR